MRNTHCRRGHELTPDNVYTRKKGGRREKGGREYEECRQCLRWRTEGRKSTSWRSAYMVNQRALNTATIERADMPECPTCLPSLVSGRRGRMGVDEDGFAKCHECGRGAQVTIVLQEVN